MVRQERQKEMVELNCPDGNFGPGIIAEQWMVGLAAEEIPGFLASFKLEGLTLPGIVRHLLNRWRLAEKCGLLDLGAGCHCARQNRLHGISVLRFVAVEARQDAPLHVGMPQAVVYVALKDWARADLDKELSRFAQLLDRCREAHRLPHVAPPVVTRQGAALDLRALDSGDEGNGGRAWRQVRQRREQGLAHRLHE